jgi:Tfp pilus assembly protein FimT
MRRPRRGQAGFSLAELLVLVAIIGILMTLSVPFFLNYYRAAAVKAAAEEVVTFLNQGRQIAIKENTSVCAAIDNNAMHFHLINCSGTVWVGPGTDAAGNIRIPPGFTLTTTAQPIFNYLGAAAPAATFTIRHTQSGRQMTVTVNTAGRVSIP